MKSEVQSVTTKQVENKYGVRGWQTSGVHKEIHKQSNTNNGGAKIKNGGAQVNNMVRTNFYSK